jgi:septum site-determining protein MinD
MALIDIARRIAGEEVPMVYHGQKKGLLERLFGV